MKACSNCKNWIDATDECSVSLWPCFDPENENFNTSNAMPDTNKDKNEETDCFYHSPV